MAKTKKVKLPKRIAGVKVPKELRKNGGWLLGMLDTPQGKALVASGLAAAAAAMTGAKLPRGGMNVKKAKRRVSFVAQEGADRASDIAQAAAGAVTAALDRWFGADDAPKSAKSGSKGLAGKGAGAVAH
jgi:hypothetical protein